MKRCALWLLCSLLALMTACATRTQMRLPTSAPTDTPPATASPAPTPTPSPTPTETPAPTPSPTPTPNPEDAYFSDEEEVSVSDDRTHYSYTSPTLSIEIRQKYDEETETRYWVAHIRTRGAETIHTGFSNLQAPGYKRLKPYRIARQLGAVYLQNGDFFIETQNPQGVVMREGVVYHDGDRADTLAILPDGTLRAYFAGETSAKRLQAMGVQDAISFGPILVMDGKMVENVDKKRLAGRNPRSGIGVVDNHHLVGIVVEGMYDGLSNGATFSEYAQMFLDEGCTMAYNFDGGASSSMVFMGDSCNTHGVTGGVYGQRPVPDVIWFGVSESVPSLDDKVINDGQALKKTEEKLETVQYGPQKSQAPESE